MFNFSIPLSGTSTEMFAQAAALNEVFGINQCEACKSKNIRPRVRVVEKGKKTYTYYEYVCSDCYARLSLGQHQTGGTMFPKRKDKDGNPLENKGWVKYNPNAKDDDEDD